MAVGVTIVDEQKLISESLSLHTWEKSVMYYTDTDENITWQACDNMAQHASN